MTDDDALVPIPSPGVALDYGEIGRPFVVLVHDWYGRLPWLDGYATALASYGFRVSVPDLFSGVATIDETTAGRLAQQLDVGSALADIDDLIETARAQGSKRVGVVGFSLGGWLALIHAQSGSADAVVAYYATLSPAEHGVIPSPVLLNFAEVDEWAPGGEPDDFVSRLKEHGTPVSSYVFPGTVHSFANATILDRVDEVQAPIAFGRTATFLEQHLLD